MKLRVNSGGKFVASTVQGAVLLLNQPAQSQVTREATVPGDFEQQQQHSVPFSAAVMPSAYIESGTTLGQIVIPIEATWDNAAKKRFKMLATKEALGEISSDEQLELESLSLLRRKSESPVEPEEILWEYKQRKLASELMRLLEKYVEFHRPRENSSRSEGA